MRTIKFRAWSRKEKVMTGAWSLNEIPVAILTKKLDCEVMQFTGLKDREGREIYEGDLVLFGSWEKPWQIAWNEDCARFDLLWVQGGEKGFLNLCNEDDEKVTLDLRVVGNCYENPELLEPKP